MPLSCPRKTSLNAISLLAWVFFTASLIVFESYINPSNLLHTEITEFESHKQFIPLNKSSNEMPPQPSLIIIGSVNGGTSLLNDIYAFFLNSFIDDYKRRDTFYWSRCIPCDEYPIRTTNFYNWNVSQYNLCNPQPKIKKIKKKTGNPLFECRIDDYKSLIIQDSASLLSQFSAERCSAYNYAPYVPAILATLFPKTILLYSIREKATQTYSRAKNFHKSLQNRFRNKELYFNHQFKSHMDEIESDAVQNSLLPLLKKGSKTQTEQTRDDIIWWYLNYPSTKFKGKRNSPFQIAFRDLCPYINVLLYKKMLSVYNMEYGYSKLKIVESEWLFANVLRAVRFVQCIVSVGDCNSNLEMEECDKYYQNNMDEIMDERNQKTLMDNTYGKKDKYKHLLSDLETFDKLSVFWQLCDKRLFELIVEFPSLTVGTKWDYRVWTIQRQKMRDTIINKTKQK